MNKIMLTLAAVMTMSFAVCKPSDYTAEWKCRRKALAYSKYHSEQNLVKRLWFQRKKL